MSIYFGIVGQQQGYVFKYDNHIIFMYHMILCYCIYLTSISSTDLSYDNTIHPFVGICHYSVGHFYAKRPPTKDANLRPLPWGAVQLKSSSWARSPLEHPMTWTRLPQGKDGFCRDRSMGLLWVYTVEWAKLVYFPGEKHDFFQKIHGIYAFFRIIMTLDICLLQLIGTP